MSFVHTTEDYYAYVNEDEREKPSIVSHGKSIEDHEFIYPRELFTDLMSHFQEPKIVNAILSEIGGIQGISFALRTDAHMGLPGDEVATKSSFENSVNIRSQLYGTNQLTKQDAATFLQLCWIELQDFMLRILIVCSLISIIVGLIFEFEENGWIDGLAILVAVSIVVLVGGVNNYSKEKQFRIMESESEKKMTIVLRNGIEKEVSFTDIVIGDLIVLRAGYTVPCDGVYVFGTDNFTADEAGLTGESKEIKKTRQTPLLMAGTNISQGDGLMIAVAVGDSTQWGQLMAGYGCSLYFVIALAQSLLAVLCLVFCCGLVKDPTDRKTQQTPVACGEWSILFFFCLILGLNVMFRLC